ncbi:MAG: phosphoribosylformylglycinamidine synthase subunit PurL, partial [Ignavibacteriaceae bacterium]
KNSIAQLKTLPRSGGRLLVGAGEENAGLVDIGDGLAVAFKIESHNHPSAVEPYQGAATGVGGIMRDIFTMGARPIASLNSLRFGSLKDARTRYLFSGVVKGIGDYGNSFGVPTVAGEVYFDESYQGNPLVNAMAVGIVKTKRFASATAKGERNPVMIVGSSTGRDGIHGATYASEELSEKSEAKRPSVQVGDPFTEKLLLEASLEIIKNGWLIGIQDMGAAGISCSTSEMSAKGNSGMKINLDKVPLREEGMTAYEIMLSESQERMLCVVKKGYEDRVKNVLEKWDLHCEIIGEVTNDGLLHIDYEGEIKAVVHEQYDTMVRTNTIVGPGCDAAVIYIKGLEKALAMKTDCNSRYVYLDPKEGAKIAVAEAARNIVCSGGVPLAITNCLNFGNPYKPEVYWQFAQAIEGMGETCRFLNTPVTGGNVSFYNESPDVAVYPTPTIGMVGLVEDLNHVTTSYFKNEGDLVFLLGEDHEELGGSEYVKVVHNKVAGNSPEINLQTEKTLHESLLNLIRRGLINSAHDISEGGIGAALAECCIINQEKMLGCEVEIPITSRKDFSLFSESQSRIIISVSPAIQNAVETELNSLSQSFKLLGKVTGQKLKIINYFEISLSDLNDIYYKTIPRIMGSEE